MIKAGEAGGALEVILKRLAEFQERTRPSPQGQRRHGLPGHRGHLRRRHPGLHHAARSCRSSSRSSRTSAPKLPVMTVMLIATSKWVDNYWYLMPGIPIGIWLFIKLLRKFSRRADGLGHVHAEDADLRPVGGEEHRRPHHPHPGHPGGQRRAHPRGPAHHPRHLRQRRLRAASTRRSTRRSARASRSPSR